MNTFAVWIYHFLNSLGDWDLDTHLLHRIEVKLYPCFRKLSKPFFLQDPSVLQEKLHYARLKLQKLISLNAKADEKISRMTAVASQMVRKRDEAYVKYRAMLAELQARRKAQMMMMATLPSGPPATAFSCYSNGVPLGPTTVQGQYYAQAAGVSCFTPSSARTGSFDPDMLMVDAAEGDSVVRATGSGWPVMAEKKKGSGSELGLVAEQILRLSRKKEEAVEARVHDDAGTSAEGTFVDSESTKVGDLGDVVSSAGKKRGEDAS
jgi:hypothetical protein